MNDLSLYFIEQFRNGESGYYAPRQRGTVDVFEDSKRYIYDNLKAKRIKPMILEAFSNNGKTTVKILGRYPSYRVETE